MNEKLKMALEKLEQNPEIMAEVKKNPPKTKEDFIAIAAQLGVEITKEELEAATKEMSLEELDQSAGGVNKDQILALCGNSQLLICAVTLSTAYFTR